MWSASIDDHSYGAGCLMNSRTRETMSQFDQCSLFVRTESEIAEIRQAFGLNEKTVIEAVDSIMGWFNKQPHLVRAGLDRAIAERIIIIAKGSLERAKEKIDAFYRYRSLLPDYIQNREEILHNPTKIYDSFFLAPLPRLQENRIITFLQFGQDPTKFDLVDMYRKLCMHMDLRIKYDYMLGDIWILDMEHVSWTQILTQNPLVFKKMADMFTKSLNWRIYGIHVINLAVSAAIVQRLLDFFNQFVTSIIMSRIVVHENLEDLYQHVPKECLPEDYGGNAPSIQKLTEFIENEYRKPETISYLLDASKMVSDESARPCDKNSEQFLAGSFRKLEVD